MLNSEEEIRKEMSEMLDEELLDNKEEREFINGQLEEMNESLVKMNDGLIKLIQFISSDGEINKVKNELEMLFDNSSKEMNNFFEGKKNFYDSQLKDISYQIANHRSCFNKMKRKIEVYRVTTIVFFIAIIILFLKVFNII